MNDGGAQLLVSVDEAARRLSLGRSLVYTLVMAGRIHSVKIGRARRIPVASLERFVEERLAEEEGDQPTEALEAR